MVGLKCQEIARKLRINKKIDWIGWVSKEVSIAILKYSDLLVHTSIKEGTPHVVMGALSLGKPKVCHDTCGMGSAVTEQCAEKFL